MRILPRMLMMRLNRMMINKVVRVLDSVPDILDKLFYCLKCFMY